MGTNLRACVVPKQCFCPDQQSSPNRPAQTTENLSASAVLNGSTSDGKDTTFSRAAKLSTSTALAAEVQLPPRDEVRLQPLASSQTPASIERARIHPCPLLLILESIWVTRRWLRIFLVGPQTNPCILPS